MKPANRIAAAAAVTCGMILGANASALEVSVISSAPQLVTGSDALIQITGLTRLPTVTLRGRQVRVDLRTDPKDPGKWVGVLYGLLDGNNELTVTSGRETASLNIVSHPINGTLFAGPQDSPFLCELDSFGFKPTNTTHLDPHEADCAVSPRVAYYYRDTAGKWKPFDAAAARPSDIDKGANGQAMIIRQETGVINRAAYVMSVPHDPAAGDAPSPGERGTGGWNGKLMYSFGPGARGDGHHQGRGYGGLNGGTQFVGDTNGAMNWYIDHGYAVAAASLNSFGTTTDAVVSAETAYKVKEHFIESYGPPIFTIGNGQSGGSMQQQIINNAYPGILDGVIPALLYADGMTFFRPLFDCELLVNVFKQGNWTREQLDAVSGKYWGFCVSNARRFPSLDISNCDGAVAKMVTDNPTTIRPEEVRCTFQDDLVQVFGVDPKTGVARSPWDNVGVQYGLKALNDGVISFDQFVDINKRIGGHDINGKIVAQREVGDPIALRAAYATGQVNQTNGGNANVPNISIRYYFDGDPFGRGDANVNVHDRYHSSIVEARLKKYNGNADNYVRLLGATIGDGYGPNPSVAGSPYNLLATEAAESMDAWLTAIKADTSNTPMAKKVAANRPKSLVNACWTVDGKNTADWTAKDAVRGKVEKLTDWAACNKVFAEYTDARIAAGGPMTDDIFKCQLKPIDAKDYKTAPTADQLAALKAAFPDGVCDWTKPGVGQDAKLQTWAIFQDGGRWTGL